LAHFRLLGAPVSKGSDIKSEIRIGRLARVKGNLGQKTRQNLGLFTPVKIGGVNYGKPVQPRTHYLRTCKR